MKISTNYQQRTIKSSFKGALTIRDWPSELEPIREDFTKYAQQKAKKIYPELHILGWTIEKDRKGISFRFYWPLQSMSNHPMEYTSIPTLDELKKGLDEAMIDSFGHR